MGVWGAKTSEATVQCNIVPIKQVSVHHLFVFNCLNMNFWDDVGYPARRGLVLGQMRGVLSEVRGRSTPPRGSVKHTDYCTMHFEIKNLSSFLISIGITFAARYP